MNNAIEELIKFIKENIEVDNRISYIVQLNDKNITLSYSHTRWAEIATFDLEGEMSMPNFIKELSRRIIEEIPIEDLFVQIKTHTFEGPKALIDSGPIELYFGTENDKSFFIRFSSNDEKNRNWLSDFVKYVEQKEESESTKEFSEIYNYIYGLEDEQYEKNMNKEEEKIK